MQIALYQPDIPQNVGSIVRLAACMEVPLHIIEPCGFIFDVHKLKRSAMDYGQHAQLKRHASWEGFLDWKQQDAPEARLVLFTTRGAARLDGFAFQPADILLFGRESSGVPEAVHALADAAVVIPISARTRSLNIAQAVTAGLTEGLRQTNRFPQGSAA